MSTASYPPTASMTTTFPLDGPSAKPAQTVDGPALALRGGGSSNGSHKGDDEKKEEPGCCFQCFVSDPPGACLHLMRIELTGSFWACSVRAAARS